MSGLYNKSNRDNNNNKSDLAVTAALVHCLCKQWLQGRHLIYSRKTWLMKFQSCWTAGIWLKPAWHQQHYFAVGLSRCSTKTIVLWLLPGDMACAVTQPTHNNSLLLTTVTVHCRAQYTEYRVNSAVSISPSHRVATFSLSQSGTGVSLPRPPSPLFSPSPFTSLPLSLPFLPLYPLPHLKSRPL